MAASTLPPLISSDGHLEVRPERWTPRMPARYRERAPRTVKLPDSGDAILVEGQPPYPAPFLDLRAGRTSRDLAALQCHRRRRPSDYVRRHISPHIECGWPNTRPFAERLLAGVPADEAFRIASGNVLDFFHLRDTTVGRKALAAAE